MKTTLLHLSLVLALASACGGGRKASWESGGSAAPAQPASADAQAAAASLLTAAEEAWNARADQARLEEAIAKWEEAAKATPTAELYSKLSRAYYFLAESAYSFDKSKEQQMLDTYDKGVRAGEQAVALSSPEFVKRVKAGDKWEDAVAVMTQEGVPALYWYATNLGKWARAKGFTTVLSNRDRLKGTMTRVLSLDPDYFYAAPHRYFGAYYSVAPAFAGGDLAKSELHFKESLNRAPNYLATKVLMADTFAVKKQDKELFKRLLEEVIAADANVLPDIVPEQTLEKKKAEDMLKKIDDLF